MSEPFTTALDQCVAFALEICLEYEIHLGQCNIREASDFEETLYYLREAEEKGAPLVARIVQALDPNLTRRLEMMGPHEVWQSLWDERWIGNGMSLFDILELLDNGGLRKALPFKP